MAKGQAFLIASLSLIAGLILANFLPSALVVNDILWFSLSIASLIIVYYFRHYQQAYWFLVGLFLLLGIWCFSLSLPQDKPNRIWYYNGQTINFIGQIDQEPEVRMDQVKLVIKAQQLISQDSINPISGLVLITTNLYPQYAYGEILKLECTLQAPVKFTDFAYDKYLARYHIYTVCYYPIIERQQPAEPSIIGQIIVCKQKLASLLDKNLPLPEASLAKAILLGYKKDLPEVWRQKFSQAGLSHITAISGLHIGIIGLIIMQVLLACGIKRKYVFYFSSIILWFYIILINAPASAVRAGMMGQLVLLAVHLGRLNKSLNALVLAAALMLLINPGIIYDLGWQLSFLAVLGIIYIYPLIKKVFLKFKFETKYFSDIIAISLAAQIITWPIIALNFSQVSLIAPIANILVLWLLPVLLICLLLAILLTIILPGLVIIWWLPSYLGLHYIMLIADWLTKIPYSYLEL